MDTYRVELVNRGGIEIDVAPDVQILDAILRWRGDANEQGSIPVVREVLADDRTILT